jgi:hypothetical protein
VIEDAAVGQSDIGHRATVLVDVAGDGQNCSLLHAGAVGINHRLGDIRFVA